MENARERHKTLDLRENVLSPMRSPWVQRDHRLGSVVLKPNAGSQGCPSVLLHGDVCVVPAQAMLTYACIPPTPPTPSHAHTASSVRFLLPSKTSGICTSDCLLVSPMRGIGAAQQAETTQSQLCPLPVPPQALACPCFSSGKVDRQWVPAPIPWDLILMLPAPVSGRSQQTSPREWAQALLPLLWNVALQRAHQLPE